MEYTWVTLKKNNWGHTHKMLHVLFVSAKAISCITSDRCYKIICDDAFLRRPAISKINKGRRADYCEAEEVAIQDPKGCCTFQMPLVYNRVC
jgi:hypothetical protein